VDSLSGLTHERSGLDFLDIAGWILVSDRRPGDRLSGVLVDAPTVARRVVALFPVVAAVRCALRNVRVVRSR